MITVVANSSFDITLTQVHAWGHFMTLFHRTRKSQLEIKEREMTFPFPTHREGGEEPRTQSGQVPSGLAVWIQGQKRTLGTSDSLHAPMDTIRKITFLLAIYICRGHLRVVLKKHQSWTSKNWHRMKQGHVVLKDVQKWKRAIILKAQIIKHLWSIFGFFVSDLFVHGGPWILIKCSVYHWSSYSKGCYLKYRQALTTAAENTNCSLHITWCSGPVWQTAVSVLYKFSITELSPKMKCLASFGHFQLQQLSSIFFLNSC